MEQHTEEPWEWDIGRPDNYGLSWLGNKNTPKSVIHSLYSGHIDEVHRERIIACINACAGISTEELKTFKVGALCQILQKYAETT